jgi:hypothetical protein
VDSAKVKVAKNKKNGKFVALKLLEEGLDY